MLRKGRERYCYARRNKLKMLTSPTNTTNLQHLNMTMETSDEVSTRQEVGMESSICDSLVKRGGFVEGRLETLENC